MFLPELSIRRPVLATVMSLILVLIGFLSYERLSVREYPKIDPPVVSVRTVYRGASAEIIESQVTNPMEKSLAGIEGIRTIKSVSREEVSQITVEFLSDRDNDAAANDVRDRVARVRASLPDDAEDSVVAKVDADAQAIIWLALYSDKHSPLEITDYADRYVKDRLQTLPGVASVIIGGERRYAMRIWLDRERLAAYQLTVQDVENALRKNNVDIPSGRIESSQREFTVFTETGLQTPEQFNDMIVRQVGGYPVRVKDVGYAALGAFDDRNVVRVNGNPAVGLGIVKQSTANTLAVGQEVKAQLPKIIAALPEGMQVKVAFDSSLFIDASIKSVYHTIFEALALVVLVIFIFLRTLRATLVPFVTIPVSLIASFTLLQAMGFSINVLTLLGMVLAIGLVVDDAIVVLENIYRKMEEGMPRLQAALEGSREIAFAVVAMTLTLVAVFAPLAFFQGNTGRLLKEFALSVTGSVLVSGFVALTLTPMMCSRLLSQSTEQGALYRVTERFFLALNHGYGRVVSVALKLRWLIVLLAIGTAVGGWYSFKTLKSELAPLEDRGTIIGIISAPEGATLDYTDKYARLIEGFYSKIPEVNTYFMVIAPGLEKPNPVNFALSFVRLKPWDERQRTQQDIAKELAPKMFGLPGVFAFPINPPSLGQSFRNPPVQFVVMGTSYSELQKTVDAIMAKARSFPGLANVDSDLKLNKPRLTVNVDRDKASAVEVDVDVIGRTLESLLGGRQVTRFKREGDQYDVVVKLEDKDRNQPDDLTSIYVRGQNGELVQLSNLVSVSETVAPKELNHFNRFRASIISANINPGYTLGDALNFLDQTAKEALPKDAQTALDGQSREFKESGAELYLIFLLALAFIYLVLAAQFESFIDPIVILVTVPLALTGAIVAINWSGGTLNVYTQVGFVMLIGLISKHGILIVNYANQLRDQGMEKIPAVIKAATMRLRPILMTTAAMVLGAVPLAMATGAGAETRHPIGWVIVGGMMLGTILTLFVVPAVYSLLSRKRHVISDVSVSEHR